MDDDFLDAPGPPADGGNDGAQRDAATERVGVPAVDAVLEEIESVGDLPVAEQVTVFERAHERLRRALDPVDDSADAPAPDDHFAPDDQER